MVKRPRRNRKSKAIRDLNAEINILPKQFIIPHFLLPKPTEREEILSMPGRFKLGIEELLKEVDIDLKIGINAVLLFGQPGSLSDKFPDGREAWNSKGVIQNAVRRLKDTFGDEVIVITDVCLCAYTDHGHCGFVKNSHVINDLSLDAIANIALSHAEAGADIVAPSDMMDGRVKKIRETLDKEDLENVGILSYAVKYASAYYGPFREAADSSPNDGDRKTYQMDIRNVKEAIREAKIDEEEGADMLMVKPALAFLDIIKTVSSECSLPLSAYNVSGEYSAVKAAAEKGWLDEASVVRENLYAIARAGANQIISYHARDAIKGQWL
ncbi:MAG: porphobilinogen synthase [Pseudomonadota bacterium]|nr:porphobilinogen synthase [Gammaproteobacteria bacterium]MEE2683738.1 porphobilinogen synthase [Pseudomonadota bacterium]